MQARVDADVADVLDAALAAHARADHDDEHREPCQRRADALGDALRISLEDDRDVDDPVSGTHGPASGTDGLASGPGGSDVSPGGPASTPYESATGAEGVAVARRTHRARRRIDHTVLVSAQVLVDASSGGFEADDRCEVDGHPAGRARRLACDAAIARGLTGNLIWACSHHHWLVHEGGWNLRRTPIGTVVLVRPDDTVVRE